MFNKKGIPGHLNEVLELLPGSIYIKDVDGVYLGCNRFQAKMAGLDSPEQIIGKTDYDLSWKSMADLIRANDKQVMESRTQQDLVEKARLFDQTEITMQSIKAPLYDDSGEVIGIVGTSIDITAQKAAEDRELAALVKVADAEEETRRAVMILAGSIAHDLRSPLATIRLMNKVLHDSLPTLVDTYDRMQKTILPTVPPINKLYQQSLRDIPDNLENVINGMNMFINDTMKALSRVVLGDSLATEDLIPCESETCIRHALEAYSFTDKERDLIHWDKSYTFTFLGNPILFLRVLFNLFKNSLYQINQEGRGKIFISAEEGQTHNIIRFKDTAGGASLEVIKHIFEGYRTTKKDGTGIGLAFCKLTLESFDASISCHSIEGDYIEFVLSFPKTNTTAARIANITKKKAANNSHSKNWSTSHLEDQHELENEDEFPSREELMNLLEQERSEKNFLRSVIGKIPGHLYWLNRDNIYLGCNDNQARSFGINSGSDVIGKTNHDLLPEKEAHALNETNKKVMESGAIYVGEEFASMCGKYGNYLSQKVPLQDENGKIIGLLGMSIDITDQEKAEDLEF